MRKFFIIAISFLVFGITAKAQTTTVDYPALPCPVDKVCISRDAALKAVETAAERDALKVQIKTEQQAVEDMRKELNEVRIKFAAASGELSGLKQNAVQDRAIIEVLLKSVRPKKIGLINLF